MDVDGAAGALVGDSAVVGAVVVGACEERRRWRPAPSRSGLMVATAVLGVLLVRRASGAAMVVGSSAVADV